MKALWYALDDLSQRYLYERPSQRYRRQLLHAVRFPDFLPKAEQLSQNGVLILPSYFQPSVVAGMREDFHKWAQGKKEDSLGRILVSESTGAFLRDSFHFSAAAVDTYLTALVRYYWGKPVVLSHACGLRIHPTPPEGKDVGPFQWHHDANRKQVKAMILLDDVAPDGQRMDYLPKTHRIWHRFRRGEAGYEETRFSQESVARYGELVRCAGPAGTVILFDTNGLHRGNRNLGPRRDVWTFQYTAGRHMEPLSGLHPHVTRQMDRCQRRFARFPLFGH